ncbi:MAG: hypothetical protein JNK26_05190 [Candidatus Doudnabacteria bacterium]|nr:hypothetical protein [Candidatus Doudnabacteria bacterium]
METLLLVDGHNFLFKSFAVPFKFRSSKGTPLHVCTTFISLLRRAVNATSADCVTVVFDAQEKTSNNLLSDSYKANRKKDYSQDEDSPFNHLPIIKAALDYLNVCWLEKPGIEADDLIASLTCQFLKESAERVAYIASNDTDFYQLVSYNVKIIQLKAKQQYLILDTDYLSKVLGLNVEQYVELKSWVGDKVDNIVGIPGIGWKRAQEILDGKRVRDLSDEEIKLLELNRRLIRLNCELQIGCEFSEVGDLLRKSNREVFEALDN